MIQVRKLLPLCPALVSLSLASCDDAGESETVGSSCGPGVGVVTRIVDGDTVELDSGEMIRYLLVDTPETTQGKMDCWGVEAREANRALVEGQEVSLHYDVECTDRFGRLLAYVSVGDRVINELMIERGHACVLHIPPNGGDVINEYRALEAKAMTEDRGIWGACDPVPCL